jgi:osmotically-inducible protein OsmY
VFAPPAQASAEGGRRGVGVHDGVVTLRGEALGLAQLKLTAEHAGDVDGVTEVLNEMTIRRKLEPAKPAVAEVIDDASITAEVRATLAAHRSTRDAGAKIQAADGVVTIQGVARSEAERDSVTRLAADVEGVLRVVNRMTLAVPGAERPQ